MLLYNLRCSRCSRLFLKPLYSLHNSQYRYKSARNYYEVLGVPHNATQEQIKTAFLELSKKVHPDQNHGTGSHEKFIGVNEAYTVLSKPHSRRDYDMEMKFSMHPDNRNNNYRDTEDPFDVKGQFRYGHDKPNDIPYWKKDPFSDYGYQYEQRKRMREWAQQMARQNARRKYTYSHPKDPLQHDDTPSKTWRHFLIIILIICWIRAYWEHPERFRPKLVKDTELTELIDRRSRERLARKQAYTDDSDLEVARVIEDASEEAELEKQADYAQDFSNNGLAVEQR